MTDEQVARHRPHHEATSRCNDQEHGMDPTGLTKKLILDPDLVVPLRIEHGPIRAHAITRKDLEDDVAGINRSLDLILRTRGGSWPTGPVTREGNYVDLVWHECEFRDGRSFTYVLTNPEHGYIGCLYLYPLGVREPLTAELLDCDVDVSWWVTPTAYNSGMYVATYTAVHHWMGHQLPFVAPHYSNAELPSQ